MEPHLSGTGATSNQDADTQQTSTTMSHQTIMQTRPHMHGGIVSQVKRLHLVTLSML